MRSAKCLLMIKSTVKPMNQLIKVEFMMLRIIYPCQLHVLEFLLGEGFLLRHVEADTLARPVLLLNHHATLYTERNSTYQGLKGLYRQMGNLQYIKSVLLYVRRWFQIFWILIFN